MTKKVPLQESAGRLVMAVFHKNKAYNETKALPIEAFKDVPLSSDMIGYTFGNLIGEKVIVKTNDERFYFDELVWKRLEKRFNRAYWVMLLAPLIALLIFLFFMNYDKVMNWIKGGILWLS